MRTWQGYGQTRRSRSASARNEFRLRFADGDYRWVSSQTNIIRDAQGNGIAWCSILTDIDTYRRSAEEHEMFTALPENCSDMVTMRDSYGRDSLCKSGCA